ncbi:MAG: hypothetical protein FJW51_02375 [Actinobacteria bacterium]|nr:hypothetical protein [Actinomycetota bacterium]
MEILNLEGPKRPKGKHPFLKGLLGLGALSALAGISMTVAAQININAGSGSVEFGQGSATTITCDEEVTVTPYSGYVNLSDTAAMFTVDSIEVAGISDACIGSDFVLRVFSSTSGTAAANLTNSDSGTVFYDYARISYSAGKQFSQVGNGYVWIEADTATTNSATFEVVLDPDEIDSGQIIDARNVSKVTLETVKTGS